jgi:MFS family permease
MTRPQKHTLGVVFVTLFLDLIGFSIIFPLFPSMLEFYDGRNDPVFSAFHHFLEQVSAWAGVPDASWGVLVLFGGILGSIYSLLQFAFTPIVGALSDRVGRRPVLLVTLVGNMIAYALWFFAAPFTMLLLSRFLGGIMSANISTATAIVSDTTTEQNRGRGMAIIGIAFGLGFIMGPAVGGAAALLDLTAYAPDLAAWGINPFSMPAAVAFLLTMANVIQVYLRLPESAPLKEKTTSARTANPLALFRATGIPGVTRTNFTYFVFLLAFSGMEFSLTFLAVQFFEFGPGQNAVMLVFVGLVLAFVQGGYVRRKADQIGPRILATRGLFLVAPSLALIGFAADMESLVLLFLGLFFLATGAAMVIPCLTALVSMYAPADAQGRYLGTFRSLGALGRGIGPLIASVLYWRLGAVPLYLCSAVALLLPLYLARDLPEPHGQDAPTEAAPESAA